MDSTDYWVMGNLIIEVNTIAIIIITYAIIIYHAIEFIRFISEQKQPWHREFLT